jgi:hypothetical protein
MVACGGDDGEPGGGAGAGAGVGAAAGFGPGPGAGAGAGAARPPSAGGVALTAVTASEYERLCQRLEEDELGTWLECTESDSCQRCLDELLSLESDSCEERIGTPERYTAMACPWTVAMLDACLDERHALMLAISCERPPQAGEESACLKEFRDACVRTPMPAEPAPPPSASGCDDTCQSPDDGECDDGGPDSITDGCGLGTDCTDCGPR